ncbi:hypothetical protein NB311A_13216 [Nitrobacter sp. Nb-311A]|uniref:hypothetical protein n=1 Tax=Nitrobacter sp. Nb-311A TaxID=314253 RepID=UPI0000684A2A|nr:hypothetical protein [Nitrobacter sp. Nb-311A]EAQ35278.1 hypothetical protein NB311A_13216 [Nitrobacter sp. Nb-311A]
MRVLAEKIGDGLWVISGHGSQIKRTGRQAVPGCSGHFDCRARRLIQAEEDVAGKALAHPYAVMLPQSNTERLLETHLKLLAVQTKSN